MTLPDGGLFHTLVDRDGDAARWSVAPNTADKHIYGSSFSYESSSLSMEGGC